MKTIKVSDEQWQYLMNVKIAKKFKKVNDAIDWLIQREKDKE